MTSSPYRDANMFLKNNVLGILATVSSETGFPQGGLVYYIPDEKAHIYITTSLDSSKYVNLHKNAKAAFIVCHNEKPIELQIEATSRDVTESAIKEKVLNEIALIANANPRTQGWPPLLTLSMNSEIVCIELTIERFKYSDFSIRPGNILSGTGKELLYNYS